MVEKSNIQDKDLILQVLSMYDSSAERENQIKNMSSVYGELKEDVLPKLRRAQLVNNMEITGKSDAEMQALVSSGKLDELNNEELLHVATLIEDNAVKAKVLEYAAKKYDDSRAYTNLGAAYLQMGDADKALAALTQAVKLGGNTQELNSNLALANLAAGNVDEAKKYAAAADAQTKSLIAAAQGQYGDAAAKLKGYNAAVAAVMNNDLSAAKKALAGENSADADYLRAVIATKEGDMKTAGAQLKAAVAKIPPWRRRRRRMSTSSPCSRAVSSSENTLLSDKRGCTDYEFRVRFEPGIFLIFWSEFCVCSGKMVIFV